MFTDNILLPHKMYCHLIESTLGKSFRKMLLQRLFQS